MADDEFAGREARYPFALGGRWPARRRGAILLLVALAMVALMSVLVLALDGGIIQRQKRVAQMAADAAAQAGAIEIYRSRAESTAASARSEATRNGFTNGVGGKAVTVTYPNTTGSFTGTNFVRVLVQDTVYTLFGSLLGRAKVVVNARAVGGVTGTTQACIATLDPDDRNALEVASGAIVNAIGCKVAVNSNDPQAMRVAGSTLNADGISITGGYVNSHGIISPTPVTGAPPAAEPLASYVNLAVSDTTGACIGGSYALFKVVTDSTLNPGIYCGGISVTKNTGIGRFNPGLYIIKGGGFSVSAGGTVIGNGVSFANLNAPAANGGSAKFDVVDYGSDAVADLTAMTSGPLAGILYYSPANAGVAGHDYQNQITSSANATMTGSLYFPGQELRLGSGGTLTINGGVVAKDVYFLSDARVNVTGFAGGSPYSVQRASVVE